MTYNLANVRQLLWGQMDDAPANSEEYKSRTDEWLRRASARLVEDAPYLFIKDLPLYVEPDIEPENDDDTLRTGATAEGDADAWVLETSYTEADEPELFAKWEDPDRIIDGRMLVFTDPDDDTHKIRVRIRAVWLETIVLEEATVVLPAVTTRRPMMSLERPIPAPSPGWDEITDWRIESSEYVLPPEVVEVRSLTHFSSTTRAPIKVVGAGEAEVLGLRDAETAGVPTYAWRQEVQVLSAPSFQPEAYITDLNARANSGTTWAGPENKGSFEYCFTIGWGRKHTEVIYGDPLQQNDLWWDTARLRPYWESAPSKITDAVDNSSVSYAVAITLPNLDAAYGFNDSGTLRYQHLGLFKYIYRRRLIDADPYGVKAALPSNRFELIAVVNAGTTTYLDRGENLPAKDAPLRRIHAHHTLVMYPKPDAKYHLRLRATVRPPELIDDTDAVRVPEDAIDALVYRALMYAYESRGNAAMKADAFNSYQLALHGLHKRHGAARPQNQTVVKRPARVSRLRRGYPDPIVRDA